MEDMRYEAPATLDAAVAALSGASAPKVLAGGTDVLVQLHIDVIEPDLLVDVKNIPEMRTVAIENGGWRIGAAVPAMEMLENADFCKTWPGVVEGVELIGSMQIKGRATVAGNICNGSPAADTTPPMIAAGAIASVIGPGGQRQVPVEDIVTGPGQTSLAKGEFVAVGVGDDAGLGNFRCRVDTAADGAFGADLIPLAVAAVNGVEPPVLEFTGQLVEIPPGNTVLGGYHGGIRSEQWRHSIHDRGYGMSLQGNDDVLLRACLGGVVGGGHLHHLLLVADEQG